MFQIINLINNDKYDGANTEFKSRKLSIKWMFKKIKYSFYNSALGLIHCGLETPYGKTGLGHQ